MNKYETPRAYQIRYLDAFPTARPGKYMSIMYKILIRRMDTGQSAVSLPKPVFSSRLAHGQPNSVLGRYN